MRLDHCSILAILTLGLAMPAVGADEGFFWTDHQGALLRTWSGQRVLQYNSAVVAQPEGVDEAFARNAHIHPVWNATGKS